MTVKLSRRIPARSRMKLDPHSLLQAQGSSLQARPLAGSIDPDSASPLFAQIKAKLRQDILEKRLLPGQKLPSEAAMQGAFGVSRITVRRAVADLQSEGLVETVNGKGSFVTRPAQAPRLGMLAGFHDHLRAQGRVTGGYLVSVRTGPAPARAAKALKVRVGTPVVISRAVRTADSVPVSYSTMFLIPTLGRETIATRVHEEDAMTLLEDLGFRLEMTQISMSAVKAGRRLSALLQVASDSPMTSIRFTPHDITGEPLMYSEVWFRPDQFTYRAIVRR